MFASETRIPQDLSRDFVYVRVGPQAGGVGFSLSLGFRDETSEPSQPGLLEHEWVVLEAELRRAEVEGRTDRLLLEARAREEAAFLRNIQATLREGGTRLIRKGSDLVMRRVEE